VGLSCCSEATRNNIWFRYDITENDVGIIAPGVCKEQNLIKNKFQTEASEEEDGSYSSEEEESTKVRDSAILRMFKSTPQLPSWDPKWKSEPILPKRNCREDFSIRAKMSARSIDPLHDEFVEEKHEARLYMHALQYSSMNELSVTYRNAESLLEKGNTIHEEVKRQGEVVKEVNRDAEATEKDIRDTSHRLKGMKSIRSKVKNIIWHKRRSSRGVIIHESDDQSANLRRSNTIPARLPSYDDKMTMQEWINEGVDRLCHVLDEVEHRQEDISKELGEQEKHFQSLNDNIDHIEHKIHHQTKIMSRIRKH